MEFKLGVLDQSPIPAGETAGRALRNSLELAQLADRLGYERYWLAEHHGTPALACASPEVLIGPIAAVTERIRVGSGGIMLPHYSPLKVAESFSMLSGMFPGRIDLGIGRAAGTSPAVSFALQRDRRQRSPDDFRDQLAELLGYFDDSVEESGPLRQISRALPSLTSPKPYLLGSSLQSAVWAAELGLPYVFADFINADGAETVEYYRRNFQPSNWLQAPYLIVASWVVCADTVDEAMRLSASVRMLMALLHRGQLIAVPSPERAREFLKREGIAPDSVPAGRRMIVGDTEQVKSGLRALAGEYGGADEFLLVNILYDHEARLRSYELTARAFSMTGSAAEREGVLV
jgi:luciferase family oxidoreductase group 1